MERTTAEQAPKLTEAKELELAQNMASWFPDYLCGVIDVPGFLPPRTVDRLQRQFGEGNASEQMVLIRDSLMMFDETHQSNLALYFCGYSNDALSILADEERSIGDSLVVLDMVFPPVAPPAPKPEPVRSTSRAISIDMNANDAVQQWQGDVSIYVPEWVQDGLCGQTDPEAFFPEKGGSTRDAKKICESCDVRDQCLEYALENNERFGIWGGLSERERRKLQGPSQRRRSA